MIEVTEINSETQEILAIRLVGGFDSDRKHIPALDCFRFENRLKYQELAEKAQDFCHISEAFLKAIIIEILKDVPDLYFDGVTYSFDIKSHTDKAMRYLLHHVIAQVNDE